MGGRGLPGRHRLGVLVARFAQVRVEVDEAGRDDDASIVDARRLVALQPVDRAQDPVLDDDLARPFPAARRVDEPGPADLEVGARCRRSNPAGRRRPRPQPPTASRRAGEQVQQRHPDGDAVRDLVGDQRLGAGRDIGRDLDALVHRPRVHDQRIGLGAPHPRVIETESRRVFTHRRQQPALHPLPLDPQRHHDIGVAQRGVHVGRHREPPARSPPAPRRPMPRTRAGAWPGRTARRRRRRRSGSRCSSARRASGARRRGSRPSPGQRRHRANRSRSVNRSSSAWVGWACQPSPPLRTCPLKCSAASYGAPDVAWRMTSIRAPSASTVRTVSMSDSPFDTDELAAAMFTTSAERFLAATSKLTRVRVDAS